MLLGGRIRSVCLGPTLLFLPRGRVLGGGLTMGGSKIKSLMFRIGVF